MSEDRRPPRRPRRWLVVIGALLALYVARLACGFVLGAMHYSKTPDFETYLHTHPVDTALLDSALASLQGSEASSTLFSGEIDPLRFDPENAELELRARTLEIGRRRGEDYGLRYRQEFAFVLDRESGDRLGFRITTPLLIAGDGLRLLAIVRSTPPEELIGPDTNGRGHAIVDVLLAAGEGAPRVRFAGLTGGEEVDVASLVRSTPGLPPLERLRLDIPWLRWLLGLAYSSDEVPDEGLLHLVSVPIYLDWERREGRLSGPSFQPGEHWASTEQYSCATRIAVREDRGGASGDSLEMTYSAEYVWNDALW